MITNAPPRSVFLRVLGGGGRFWPKVPERTVVSRPWDYGCTPMHGCARGPTNPLCMRFGCYHAASEHFQRHGLCQMDDCECNGFQERYEYKPPARELKADVVSENEARIWARPRASFPAEGHCRWCGEVKWWGTSRKRHTKVESNCGKNLVVLYRQLRKEGFCVSCGEKTHREHWGLPLCDEECRETFRVTPMSVLMTAARLQLEKAGEFAAVLEERL